MLATLHWRHIAGLDWPTITEGPLGLDALTANSLVVVIALSPHRPLGLDGSVPTRAAHLACGNDMLAIRQSSRDRVTRSGSGTYGSAAVSEVYAATVPEVRHGCGK